MKKYLFRIPVSLATILGSSALTFQAIAADSSQLQSTDEGPWSFDLVPYLWLATYSGSVDLPGVPVELPRNRISTKDAYSSHISGAFMMMAQVRYKQVGLYLDGAWLQLKTEGQVIESLNAGTEIKTDIAFGTAAATYRLSPMGKLKVDLVAGARIWHAKNEIEFHPAEAPGFSTEGSKTWYDPIVGANLRYDFSKHWYAVAIGDAGGFGVGSDLSWNVFGGVGYQFTDWFSLTLGYRYMHMDYDHDGFVMDTNVQGALLGIGFHF